MASSPSPTPSRLRTTLLAATLALSALAVLAPTAAATDCGPAVTPRWIAPADGSTQTYTSYRPLSAVASFLDDPAHCGISSFDVQLDGVDLGAYGRAEASGSSYSVDTYPFQLPLAPGHHTLRIEVVEVGGAVGVAVSGFDVSATRFDTHSYVPAPGSMAPIPLLELPLPLLSATLYAPGYESKTPLFADLQQAGGADYTVLLHTPFGDVPVACPGCPQPIAMDASLLVRADLVVAGDDVGVYGPVGADLSGE